MPTIRGYRPEDLTACRALWVELTEHHREIYRAPGIGGDDPGRFFDEHLAAVGADHIWVAEEEGAVIGLTGLIVDGTEGEVEPVVVSRGHRGTGVGSALVAHVIAAAGERGVRTLSVKPVGRNSSAIRFFRDAGFGVIGHIELFMDLAGDRTWVEGEHIADRTFKV